MVNYIKWTKEHDIKLIELCSIGKYSYKYISNIVGHSSESCGKRAAILGIKNPYIVRKYTVNENFWSVPNLVNSYWSGFAAADASIRKETENNGVFTIKLSSKDIQHLNTFKEQCNFTGPIKSFSRYVNILNKNKEAKLFYSSIIKIHSSKWLKDLEKNFNITQNKLYRLQPPNNLDNILLMAWLKGYIDGDGNIHISKNKKRVNIGFVSASENIIRWIREFININFEQRIHSVFNNYSKDGNSYRFRICGLKALVIIDYLNQFPTPFLERKWLQPLVLDRIQEYKQKYPHMFKTLNLSEIQHLIPPNSQNKISQF